MVNAENFLKSGKAEKIKKDTILYNVDDISNLNAVYYIKKGKASLEYIKSDGSVFKIILQEGDLIGLPEVYTNMQRITKASAITDMECQVWDKASFLVEAASIWELSIYTIKSLSNILKILNAEFANEQNLNINK